MATGPWNSFVPLGKLTITAAGTTTSLAANCGPLAGQVSGTQASPNRLGQALRGIELQADSANSGNIYLLPRGYTAAGNPGLIMAKIGPGGSLPFPASQMVGGGFVPENFVLDTDAGSGDQHVYGYGTLA